MRRGPEGALREGPLIGNTESCTSVEGAALWTPGHHWAGNRWLGPPPHEQKGDIRRSMTARRWASDAAR
jgi:hypothetical protein